MRSQTIRRIFVTLFFSLLLVGCGNTVIETSAPLVVASEMETSDENPTNTLQSLAESTEDDMTNPTVAEKTTLLGTQIFNFDGNEPTWYIVDDRVMGGVSRGNISISDAAVLRFSGTMSLDNNGGFSSVRSDWNPMNLSEYDGVLVRLLGDGKNYRLRIRATETGSQISYNASFETTPETWILVYVPFKDMVPTYFGSVLNIDPLDPTSIGSFGFMLSDKQPGEFDLQVDWIRAVTEDELRDYRSN